MGHLQMASLIVITVPKVCLTFCHRDESISAPVAKDKNFCLTEVNGCISLNRNHAYYYQGVGQNVLSSRHELQIFVCDIEYCDFCMAPFLGMRSLQFILKESQEMMHSGRMDVYQKQKRFSRLASYFLNYWVTATHYPSNIH